MKVNKFYRHLKVNRGQNRKCTPKPQESSTKDSASTGDPKCTCLSIV